MDVNGESVLSTGEVIEIVKSFLKNENITAIHGTTIGNAKSIMNTGLNVFRTTFIVQSEDNDPRAVASYAWKEADLGDSANIIVNIPNIVCQVATARSEKEAKEFIRQVRNGESIFSIEDLIRFFSTNEIKSAKTTSTAEYFDFLNQKFTIPKEFIKGMFIHANNTGWKTHIEYANNREAMLQHGAENLKYVENPNYLENLSIEEQREFFLRTYKGSIAVEESLDKILPLRNNDARSENFGDAPRQSSQSKDDGWERD